MTTKISRLMPFMLLITFALTAQVKKQPLDHSVYQSWKDVRYQAISDNGSFVSYEINPQKPGLDGWLFLYNAEKTKLDSFERGKNAAFTPDSRFLIFKVVPQYELERSLKLKKTKKDKMPKDSLFIYSIAGDSFIIKPELKSFQVSEKNSNIIAALVNTPGVIPEEPDSTQADSNDYWDAPKGKKSGNKGGKKKDTYTLYVYNTQSGLQKTFDKVLDFELSENNSKVLFVQSLNDTIDSFALQVFDAEANNTHILKATNGDIKSMAMDENGSVVSFLLTEDTSKIKIYDLWYGSLEKNEVALAVDDNDPAMHKGWSVSDNGRVYFSKNGEKLFFGTAPKPVEEPEDSLLAEEKYHVDIWNWQDKRIQPQQKNQLQRDLKKNYLALFLPKIKKMLQLGDTNLSRVRTYLDGDADYALGFDNAAYQRSYTWTAERAFDTWLLDLKTGKKEKILSNKKETIGISPAQKYVYWYEDADSNWYVMSIKTRKQLNASHTITYPLYQEVFDVPSIPDPYGLAGWMEDDKSLLIYDRYDLWEVNPAKPETANNLTNNYGRKNNIRLRNIVLDREQKFIEPGQKLLLKGFDEDNNREGFYSITAGEKQTAVKLIYENFSFYNPLKAKNADRLIWRKMNFRHYPDLYFSKMDFSPATRISFANPQQKDYLWGDVETVSWVSMDGRKLKGLLYKPDNFDSRKKYPMIVYYYEKNSETINKYMSPKPSYSVISFPLYTSNGYLIFVPDIYYKTGHPGKSAYECIMSGTLKMSEFPFVDKNNIGLQGQSWGGYQTAFMVTQTDFFKAAMGGAVVSNMISAYGGIRWGSGISRMFQYEEGQSRIGGSLWEYPELYIENSPVFFADRVSTPLLLMHNDNDGAVPWYQGIEFFGALRRLDKPVWMLTYNNEAHNLRKWPNRVDLSIRMMQFFDHYLKGMPAPIWMTDGIPAIKKGKINGYELKTQ